MVTLQTNKDSSSVDFELDTKIAQFGISVIKQSDKLKKVEIKQLEELFSDSELESFFRAFGRDAYLFQENNSTNIQEYNIIVAPTGFTEEQMHHSDIMTSRQKDMELVFNSLKNKNIGFIKVEKYQGLGILDLRTVQKLSESIFSQTNVGHLVITTSTLLGFMGDVAKNVADKILGEDIIAFIHPDDVSENKIIEDLHKAISDLSEILHPENNGI